MKQIVTEEKGPESKDSRKIRQKLCRMNSKLYVGDRIVDVQALDGERGDDTGPLVRTVGDEEAPPVVPGTCWR